MNQYTSGASTGGSPHLNNGNNTNQWSQARRNARSLETRLQDALKSYSKLNFRLNALIKEKQFNSINLEGGSGDPYGDVVIARKINSLITDLEDCINTLSQTRPSNQLSARSVVQRSREVLRESKQEFRKIRTSMRNKKQNADLFSSSSSRSSNRHTSNNDDNESNHLLRERSAIQNSRQAIDSLLQEAAAARDSLRDQRHVLGSAGNRLLEIGAQLPGVDKLVGMIRRRRGRDTIIIAGTIAFCGFFLIWFTFL